jgi:hypothetical protein
MKTNDEEFDEEDNHYKTTTGTETETNNDNDMTKTAAAVHDEGGDEHGTRTEGQATDTAPYDEEWPKRCRRLLGRR